MNEAILEELARLKRQERDIAERIAPLAAQVTEMMRAEGVDEVSRTFGRFMRAARRTWTYPESIESAQDALKIAKKEAEARGDATYEEKEYVIFKDTKPKETDGE